MPCASGSAPSAAAASCKVRVALRTNLRAVLTVFLTVPSPHFTPSGPIAREVPGGSLLSSVLSFVVKYCPLFDQVPTSALWCSTSKAHWPPPPRPPTPAQGLQSTGKSAGLASLSLHPVQNAHQLCRVYAGIKQQTGPICLYPRGAGVLDACFLTLAAAFCFSSPRSGALLFQ